MDLSHLGAPTGPRIRVHGGFANRMYRLDTDQGSFAVKELNLADRRWTYTVEDVFRFERAAFAAGIPMPEPISASHHTLVHRWVDGEQVPEAPVAAAYGFEIGEILARIHALDVEWTQESIEGPSSRDWPELAERAAATGQPWADELTSHVETFLAIADFVDTCERPGPVVLTHKDIHPWNLLARDGRPIVLDWELSGMLDLSSELGSTALSLAKGPGFDHIEPAIFHSVVDGYVAGGGTLPSSGPSWFVFTIGGWLGHTRSNILRCLAGVEAATGPDLALSHKVVQNGVRGLPDMYSRLPELEPTPRARGAARVAVTDLCEFVVKIAVNDPRARCLRCAAKSSLATTYFLTGIYLRRHIYVVDGFTVLAEPTRRRILDALRQHEVRGRRHKAPGADVNTLVAALALPQPTVSKHLRVLRDAGAVTVQVRGPRRIYTLAPQPFTDVMSWLQPYQQMWSDSLDALERHLDQRDKDGAEARD